MKKIILVLTLVVIVGIAFVVFSLREHQSVSTQQIQNATPLTEGSFAPSESPSKGTGTFRTLLAMNKDMSCTIAEANAGADNTSLQGTVYVSSEKMRGDFKAVKAHATTTMHVINNATSGYLWADSPEGHIAVMFDPNAYTPSATTTQQQFTLDENINYDCSPWKSDSSVFEPPVGEKFINVRAVTAASSSQNTNAIQCMTCNQIADQNSKQQCLQAFSCK